MYWKGAEVISQDPTDHFIPRWEQVSSVPTKRMSSTHCGCLGTSPLQHLPTQHLSGWHRRRWAPQKAAWLLTAFLRWTFSTTTSVTLKLSVTCVWVRSYLIHSRQGREVLTLFFPPKGKKKSSHICQIHAQCLLTMARVAACLQAFLTWKGTKECFCSQLQNLGGAQVLPR